jgi:hypothetical protein
MIMMFMVMMVMVHDDGHGDHVGGGNCTDSDGYISNVHGDGVEMVVMMVYIMMIMSWS